MDNIVEQAKETALNKQPEKAKKKSSSSNSSLLPYVANPIAIKRTFDKIIEAATPDRFTKDFLSTKLGIKGGSYVSAIPFMKRIGLLGSDGAPTDLYKQFRNSSTRGAAAAQALKNGYSLLYESNEYAHELDDDNLAELIIQITGAEKKAKTVGLTVASFNYVKSYANFDSKLTSEDSTTKNDINGTTYPSKTARPQTNQNNIKLGYTINVNLPASTDIAVYNAIFRSIKENLINE